MAGPSQQGNPDARDPESCGGDAVGHVPTPTLCTLDGQSDTDRNSASQRRPDLVLPIPGPRNRSGDGCFTSWNGAAGGVNGPAEPEIPAAP